MTCYDRFCDATVESGATALVVFRIPFRHLFEKYFLVVLVEGPAHVEDKGFDSAVDKLFHVVFAVVVFHATGEQRVSKLRPDLDPQTLPAYEFRDLGRQCGLVAFSAADQIALSQEAVEEILCQVVVANKIKA